MKSVFSLGLGLFIALAASAVFAEDHRVSGDALSAVGLGGMKVVSDEGGMQVRGKSSFVKVSSLTAVSGVVFDPGTNSFANFAMSDYAKAKDYGGKSYGWFNNGAQAQVKTSAQTVDPINVNGSTASFYLKGRAFGSTGKSFFWNP